MTTKYFYFILFFILSIISLFLFLIYQDTNENSFQNNISPNYPANVGQKETNLMSSELNVVSDIYFCPEDNCPEIIISLIENSKKTIDCAVYDISSKDLVNAFIQKQNQGLSIRFVTDNGRSSTKTSVVGSLKDSGVSVLISPSSKSYMHNKFCVFDGKTVLIGSTNFTDNSFNDSFNNFIVLKNEQLANLLLQKMDSFYDGKFSKDSFLFGKKIANTDIYFCPTDDCQSKVLEIFNSANESIECMMYSFTLSEFADAIIDSKDLVDSKIILENQQITQYSEYQRLKQEGIDVILDNQSELMHNKYCIIDNKIVLTGSMNFSLNGTNNNDETLLIIEDLEIAKSYSNNFKNYWELWKNEVN